MPGVEVYTISGLGAPGGYMPPPGYTGGGQPIAASSSSVSPVVRLQNALRALGATAGDSQLMAISIDGVVGPATVKLTNYALAHFVGATPGFPSATLTSTQIKQSAAVLADRVSARVKSSGGTVPDPPSVVARQHVSHASAPAAFEPAPEPDRRWIFWVVGGVGVLVLLSAAAVAIKKRRAATA